MTLGRIGIYKPDDQEDRPFTECWRLYFTDEFLANPPEYFTVSRPPTSPANEPWPLGTLVNCELRTYTQWVLTGRTFTYKNQKVFEGSWEE